MITLQERRVRDDRRRMERAWPTIERRRREEAIESLITDSVNARRLAA